MREQALESNAGALFGTVVAQEAGVVVEGKNETVDLEQQLTALRQHLLHATGGTV